MVWFLFWLTIVAWVAVNGGWPWAAVMIGLAMVAYWQREQWRRRNGHH